MQRLASMAKPGSTFSTPTKRSPPELDNANKKLRRRCVAMLCSPRVTTSSRPPLPSELKVAILAKRAEWLEANRTGRADISDPVEIELEALERQALTLSATVFRMWRAQDYR
jgi:hypothetical protein